LDNTILDVSISHGSPYTMIKLASKKRPQRGLRTETIWVYPFLSWKP
jgi:hypothetical protein